MMDLKFHHLGVATRKIEAEISHYQLLGYEPEGAEFIDPIQGVQGIFLVSSHAPRLELLANLQEPGVLTNWLNQGIKFYHMAYTTTDLTKAIDFYLKQGAQLVVEPVAAVAFSGRKIAFLMLRNRLLLELIEQD